MNLFLHLAFEVGIAYSATLIISESKLTAPLRDGLEEIATHSKWLVIRHLVGIFYNLFSCFLCTSVWVCFLVSFKFFNLAQYIGYFEFSVFWNGLFLTSIVWFLRVLEEKLTK